ncbi:MAG: 30S ribosomal protein S18 [Dissulfuribacterales bacterium]
MTQQDYKANTAVRKRRVYMRKKICRFCADKKLHIDYKDVRTLRYFVSERGKILSARITGVCARHQRSLTTAIKYARHMALLPFTSSHVLSD